MEKNVLRTFEAEILKIFLKRQSVSAQLSNVLIKKKGKAMQFFSFFKKKCMLITGS